MPAPQAMPAPAPMPTPPTLPEPYEVLLDADGTTLSALIAEPGTETPRGTILALHGGGARARYWDNPLDPSGSLLRLAGSLGWLAVAVDRPGYGASSEVPRERQGADSQPSIISAALDSLDRPLGAGVVIVGHSLGGIVGLRMVARPPRRDLIGIAAAGVPLRYTENQAARMRDLDVSSYHVAPKAGAERFGTPDDWFGPTGTWDTGIRGLSRQLLARTPTEEFFAARDAPDESAAIAAQVTVPVHWAVSQFEATSASPSELLARAAEIFTATAVLELHQQAGTGHNISLHHAARAYHLRVMAFAEECRLSALA